MYIVLESILANVNVLTNAANQFKFIAKLMKKITLKKTYDKK